MEEKKQYIFEVKLNNETILEKYPLNSVLTKDVTIINLIWKSKETGYSIYTVMEEGIGEFKICGVFPTELVIKGLYTVKGYISVYRGEKQLTCKSYTFKSPHVKESIKSYLETLNNMFIHVDDIYNTFKEDSIKILRNSPQKVVQSISNIDISLALDWQKKIKEDEEIQVATSTLSELGINLKDSRKILEKYGAGVIYKILENPYFLIKDIPSMNFKKCDKVAIENGFELDSLVRGQQAIITILETAASEGHCYIKKEILLNNAKDLLTFSIDYKKGKKLLEQKGQPVLKIGKSEFNIEREMLQKDIDYYEQQYKISKIKNFEFVIFKPSDKLIVSSYELLNESNKITENNNCCYLIDIYRAEEYVANKILKINQNKINFPYKNENYISEYLKKQKIILEKEQERALREITENMGGFYILNGGPGCGKTFIVKQIIAVLKMFYKQNKLNFNVKLLAPTGRASKILRDSTGMDAFTIHKGLEIKADETFAKNEENQFDCDLLIIDEGSMLDILLTKNLLQAISNNTKVIIIGDADQLPSIGPGSVLKDIIESKVVNIYTLNVPKRQLKKSTIVSNALNIAAGEMIKSDINRKDFIVLRKETEEACKDAILKGIKELIEKQKLTLKDIQVLTPQKNGSLGSIMLNYYIQNVFNPFKQGEDEVFKQKLTIRNKSIQKEVKVFFRKGDKVIHIQNNYTKDWYVKDTLLGFRKEFALKGITNGECGEIVNVEIINELGVKRQRITVEYEGGYVFYDDDFSELEHAYALTIHKSQGSQWPAVIVPIFISNPNNKNFYTNNLIYTACTRCKKVGIVVGRPDDILFSIKNRIENDRNTSLSEFLKKCSNS